MTDKIRALRAALEAMTPGEWEIEREELGADFDDEEQEAALPERVGPFTIEHDGSCEQIEADVAGVVAMRNAFPALLAIAEAAARRCDDAVPGWAPDLRAALAALEATR